MSKQELEINGINVGRSKAVQESIRADGDGLVARPRYQAVIDWRSGFETLATVANSKTIEGDEPVAYGGKANGLSPQDLLLTAVGNCLAATFVGGLSAQGITIHALRIAVSGRVNFRVAYAIERGSPGFEAIDVQVDIDTDAPKDKVDGLLKQLYPTAPIPDTILRPVPIHLNLNFA